MPHVRKLDVRTPSDNPNEIVVSVSIPRATVNFRSIDNSLPELEQELAERYPVKRVRRSRRKRNPADPTHWELNCIVELARPLVTVMGAAIVNAAVRWFRKRFPGSKGRSKQHIPRTLRPTTEHKIGLMVTEYKVFIERIAWYSVGIVNPFASVNHKEKRMADDVGTGTACTWKGHKLILTAEHVIGEAEPKDLAFFLWVDDAINWEGSGKPEKVIARVSLPIEKIVRCAEHDLAAIILRTKDLTGSSMQFCELPKRLSKRRTLKRKGSLILLGYPKDRIFNVSKTKIANAEARFNAARPTILKATIAKPPSSSLLSYRYRPKRDILLHYTPDDPKMEPYGFSGAAVWRDSAEHTVPLWTAEPTIFGVQTNAFMTSKLLLVVGGPTIKKFLEESF
jgi:hypothetical protein